jgi:Arc/MetJ-type ribon-helix-helix transcriptional regulator
MSKLPRITGEEIIAILVRAGFREDLLEKLYRLVKSKVFPNRSKAVHKTVEEKLESLNRSRLARECAKLDPKFEQSLAEEGFSGERDD